MIDWIDLNVECLHFTLGTSWYFLWSLWVLYFLGNYVLTYLLFYILGYVPLVGLLVFYLHLVFTFILASGACYFWHWHHFWRIHFCSKWWKWSPWSGVTSSFHLLSMFWHIIGLCLLSLFPLHECYLICTIYSSSTFSKCKRGWCFVVVQISFSSYFVSL